MKKYNLKGQCNCGMICYELKDKPLIVHGCHCSYCQRETGAAFAVNAVIESDNLMVTSGEASLIRLKSKSGRGQRVMRCPECQIALWSYYSSENLSFVRVGTLEHPEYCPPDIHIYTSTKLPWVILPDNIPAKKGFYSISHCWSPESLKRYEAMKTRIKSNNTFPG